MLTNQGYDAKWFWYTLEQTGIKPCIPKRKFRSLPIKYDMRGYKLHNRI
jgi:hypothetical protein